MPIDYARRLTSHERSAGANRSLGVALAFVAGAANAGGYLAVRQYTSHMTGIVSAMADGLVLGDGALLLGGVGALFSFMAGATVCAVMVNYARRARMHSTYALPLLLEAALLLCFGLLGARLAAIEGLFVPLTVMLLCFIMGLQNAVVSKLSHAEIRTTHVTGMVTDIGIELGKLLYWNRPTEAEPHVRADRHRLRLLCALVASFFVGGVAGALGFSRLGYQATVVLALLLIGLAVWPVLDDLKGVVQRWHSRLL